MRQHKNKTKITPKTQQKTRKKKDTKQKKIQNKQKKRCFKFFFANSATKQLLTHKAQKKIFAIPAVDCEIVFACNHYIFKKK